MPTVLKAVEGPLASGAKELRYVTLLWNAGNMPAATLSVSVLPRNTYLMADLTASRADAVLAAPLSVTRSVVVLPASQYRAAVRESMRKREPVTIVLSGDRKTALARGAKTALEQLAIPVATVIALEQRKKLLIHVEHALVQNLLLRAEPWSGNEQRQYFLIPTARRDRVTVAEGATAAGAALARSDWRFLENRIAVKDRVYIAGLLKDRLVRYSRADR